MDERQHHRRGRARAAPLVALVAGLLSMGALAACGEPPGGSTGQTVYTEADSGREVLAAVGDVITVKLAENPSTGYAWRATVSDGLEPRDDEFVAPSASPELVGAPGTRVLAYEVTAAGAHSIEAVYVRSWEAATSGDEKRFSLRVMVE